MSDAVVLLHSDDDVAVAIRDLPAGTSVSAPASAGVTARVDVPRGHKIALRDIAAGGLVCKYGQSIGTATRVITAGDHVHVHNLGMPDSDHPLTVSSSTAAAARQRVSAEVPTFEGICRPDGRVATRNYLVVLPQ